MIVRETEDAFVMVTQDDHARLSGEIAAHFNGHYFADDSSYAEEVLLAIREHDRAWIRLDETPFWNDRDAVPFSFMDYPLLPKLTHYTLGLDETEAMSEYAGLLCSLHYASFMTGPGAEREEIVRFLSAEHRRRQGIAERIRMPADEIVQRHFGLLQLCDDISLYVILNRPGASKQEEHPWYAGGFRRSEPLTPTGERLVARWESDREIGIGPSPFTGDFTVRLKQKRVPKSSIRQLGLQEAYHAAEASEQEIVFAGE